MPHIVCYYIGYFEIEDHQFNYTSTSEAVQYLRNLTEYKSWWMEANATWNSALDVPFSETITRNGIGFTFNMIDFDDLVDFSVISDDFRDLSNITKLVPTPWSTKSGDETGLTINLKKNRFLTAKFQNCHQNSFIVHDPFEFPDSSDGLEFGYRLSVEILITANVIQSDEDVKSVSLEKRNCYFKDERSLKFFKIYSKSNCERECLTMVTYQKCSCVPFYYIRNKTMNVCDIAGFICAWKYMNLDYINYEYTDLYKTNGICNCLSACDSISYDMEIFSAKYDKNFGPG